MTKKSNQKKQKLTKQRLWYLPEISLSNAAIIGLVAFVAIGGTFLYYWYWKWFDPLENALLLYWEMFRTFFVIVAFFMLGQSLQEKYTSDRLRTSEITGGALEELLLDKKPESIALYESIYHDHPFFSSSSSCVKSIDKNKERFTIVILCGLLYQAIDSAYDFEPIQSPSTINRWRSWLRSPYMLEAWPANRPYLHDGTVRFIEQNLFANSPRPQPSLWVQATKNPILFFLWVVVIISICVTLWYWIWYAPARFPGSFYTQMDIYVTALEAFYVALFVLIIAFDSQANVEETTLTFVNSNVGSADLQSLGHYPDSVAYYKSIYPCDRMLQQVHLVKTNPVDVEIFNTAATNTLFEEIDSTLDLYKMRPPNGYVRQWRSNFLSPIVICAWEYNVRKCFIKPEVIHFVNQRVLACASCEIY